MKSCYASGSTLFYPFDQGIAGADAQPTKIDYLKLRSAPGM